MRSYLNKVMKLKLFTLFFILSFVNSAFSQEFSRNKWQFAVFLTPKIDYRIIQAEGETELDRLYIQGHNESDKARYGLDIGLAGFYNINDNIRLKTGFEYTQTGYHYGSFRTPEIDSLSNISNYPLTFFGSEMLIKTTFFKIPIGFRYTFFKNETRNRPFVEANVKPSFPSSVFNEFNFYLTTSFTLGYTFSMIHIDQIYIGLIVDYFLKEFPVSEYNIHPFSIGLETGFVFW